MGTSSKWATQGSGRTTERRLCDIRYERIVIRAVLSSVELYLYNGLEQRATAAHDDLAPADDLDFIQPVNLILCSLSRRCLAALPLR